MKSATGTVALVLIGAALIADDGAARAQQTGGAIPSAGQVTSDTAAGELMGPLDLLDVESVGAPRLSPDGRTLLFNRSRADWDADRSVSHVWAVGVDGSRLRQMTNGPTSESSPRWAPDASRFSFLARRDDDDEAGSQLWLMPIDGGEAIQLTEHDTSIGSPVWAPGGGSIWFTAEESKTADEKAYEKVTGGAVTFPRNWKHRHLFRVDVDSGEIEQVTSGEWSVWSFTLSPAGDRIAYTRASTPLLDELPEVELHVLETTSGADARITSNPGIPESSPAFSPDGQWIAFTAGALPEAGGELDFYYESNLFVVPAAGGEPRVLAPRQRGDIERFAWATSASIIAQVNVGVRSELFRFDPGGGDGVAIALTDSDGPLGGSIEGFHLVPGYGLAFRRGTPDSPGDLWYAVSDPFDARRVTDLHGDLRARWAFPRAEVVRWAGADGQEVEGILWHPLVEPDNDSGRYPLVVQIHGGPASSVQLTLSTSWGTYIPVWTALGYAVLQPNYRGGVGYGDAFMRDMVGAYFRQADEDVYTGVDALIERGLVDPERTAIMGWSAGGHMTNWVVTQSDRFAAASSGAGAANWISMYAQSDVRIYRTPWFGGTPWQAGAPLDAYIDNSPVFSAHRATTPTLILVGQQDNRVPMAQSIEMYRALKHSGVETKLVTFPGQPHGLQRMKHRLHKMNVEIAWIERHVNGRDWEFATPPGS